MKSELAICKVSALTTVYYLSNPISTTYQMNELNQKELNSISQNHKGDWIQMQTTKLWSP